MPLIRGTIKPTPELWTPVWLSLPSCDFWTAWSAMQPSSVTLPCLHRVWFAFINVWHCQKMDEMCCMVFMLQIPLSPWPKTQPALSPIPRIWHVWNTKTVLNWAPKLWLNPCQQSHKMVFHPWPEVFGLNTTNTACKRALMVAAFTKMLSFLVPLYEAGNGMAGPRYGYLAWMSYLTLAGMLFAGALWMYSCVQGKLHVAPCCDLTKHLSQMWMWLHKQWYRQLTFTKTSERCYHAAQ